MARPIVPNQIIRANGKIHLLMANGLIAVVKGKQQRALLHRLLLGLGKDDPRQADHRDRDGLNNSRENLRIATRHQNARNRRKPSHGETSRYKGVHWRVAWRDKSVWVATIMVLGKNAHLGCFLTEREAAEAYNRAATLHHGEFASLNTFD